MLIIISPLHANAAFEQYKPLVVPIQGLKEQSNTCTPNLIKEDMCIQAKKLAGNVQKELPIKSGDNLYITNVKADNTRVIITAEMKYNRNALEHAYQNNDSDIDKAKKILSYNAENSVCQNKILMSFINLGGVIQYEYVFNDGNLFNIVAVSSCKTT